MTGMLDGQVVLVAGAGPGLGRAVALRAAAQGAAVVLAARDADRLAALAAEVEGAGGQTLTVPTDLTDPQAVTALVAAATSRFGRLDTVVANAFTAPGMRPLAETPARQIRTAVDVSVLATIDLVTAATEALAATGGSVVAINSMVLRHSQIGYAGYKIAKAGLLAAAQSLATELGPRGIRVNSVAPGYMWGESLQRYFAHLADKAGTTAEALYAQTAAETDLRRLPTPDQVADAVVFLASPMAAAITGQCLDVNCGQYHR